MIMKKSTLITLIAVLGLPATAALATVFSTNAIISAGNPTYDGQDIVVSNCTLTVNGPHAFTSLLVTSNGVVTHTADPAGTIGNRLDLTILHDATVDVSSAIQADGRGYGGSQGPGTGGQSAHSWWAGGGAGHGGNGGLGDCGNGATVNGGVAYGSLLEPTTQGSGGGWSGGAGGGVIRLTVAGTLKVDGQLRANGVSPGSGTGGGGAGGSLWLTVGTLSGAGIISVDGGASVSYGGGGAGGRIAVYHGNKLFVGSLSARGGAGSQTGGAGTIYAKASAQAVGEVLIDNLGINGATTPLTAPEPFNVTVAGGATVYPQSAIVLGNLRLATNVILMHLFTQSNLDLTVQHDLTIEPGAAIRADGLGSGPAIGEVSGYNYVSGAGGGHGGYGGFGFLGNNGYPGNERYASGGAAYGSVLQPTSPGSAGGNVRRFSSDLPMMAGTGGGAIRLHVDGTLTVNGQIGATGGPAIGNNSGGGSGGSIWVTVGTLSGSGDISADGGNGDAYGGGGGGGHIALYSANNVFVGAIYAQGGAGHQTGGAGTIYTKASAQALGEVLIYNPGTNGAMTPLTAPELFNVTIAGGATVFPQTALILGNLRLADNVTLTHLLTQSNVDLTVLRDLIIEPGAAIRADGLGSGPGVGRVSSYSYLAGGGGGHGGSGGFGYLGNGGYPGNEHYVAGGGSYGSEFQPTSQGSAGGNVRRFSSDLPMMGGTGGGAIRLNVGGTLTVNGPISAAGNSAIGNSSGGGAGGSIWVIAGAIKGISVISVLGGNGDGGNGGGGAGGRVAIYAANTAGFGNVTNQVALNGGAGFGTGSLYGAQPGNLYFQSGYLALQGIGFAPVSAVMCAVSNVDVFFNVAVNPAAVTADDVTITTPGGPLPASQITVQMLGGTQLRVGFPPQNAPGSYQVQVGPQIEDLYGSAMAQAYSAAFTIAAPLISGTVLDTNGLPVTGVTLQPGGGLGGVLTATNGQYSLPVRASWTGTVLPTKPGWLFVPSARSYTNLTANVTNQNYTLVKTIAPAISSRQQGTDCHVEWYGISSVGYQPQSSTNLVNWVDFGGSLIGTNGPLGFDFPITSAPATFFRMRVEY